MKITYNIDDRDDEMDITLEFGNGQCIINIFASRLMTGGFQLYGGDLAPFISALTGGHDMDFMLSNDSSFSLKGGKLYVNISYGEGMFCTCLVGQHAFIYADDFAGLVRILKSCS